MFSVGDNLITQNQMKGQRVDLKMVSEDVEKAESPRNEKQHKKKSELQPEGTIKSLATKREHGDITNVNQKQEAKEKDKDHCETQFDNNPGVASSSNSTKDNELKTKSEQPSGIKNSKDDLSDEEELNECCQRKRKRFEYECTSYSQEFQENGLTCIGILPGVDGRIESSDDSDQSCSSGSDGNEPVKYDLLGRSIVYGNKCSTESG